MTGIPSTQISEGFISVTGGKVWYKIIGAGDATPLITLHGGPGSSHLSFEPLQALSDERPIVFYDQLGCGNSDRPEDISLWRTERFVEELGQLRKELGMTKVHILGHSWGTMLATDYLLTQPDGVESVIMSSPCISIPRWLQDCSEYILQLPPDIQETLELHQKAGTIDSPEYKRATEEFYKRHVNRLESSPEELRRRQEARGQIVYETMWGTNEFFMNGNLRNYDRSSRLHEIKVPTLFSCGRVDEASPKTTEFYHSLVPGSEFIVYEHSAHMPYWEETELYINVVRAFLHKTEAGKSDPISYSIHKK